MADDIPPGSDPLSLGGIKEAAEAAGGEYPAQLLRAAEYTGKLHRGEHEGTVWGWLVDRLGYRIEFGGFKDPRPRAGGGYIIVGKLAHVPQHLRQEAIDGERPSRRAKVK